MMYFTFINDHPENFYFKNQKIKFHTKFDAYQNAMFTPDSCYSTYIFHNDSLTITCYNYAYAPTWYYQFKCVKNHDILDF